MALASNAMIPKARGMYAKRIQPAEYEELMRRRTVPEVAAVLKKHPYFGDSLATLSPTDPHRQQLEELLGMDIFNKYEALARYDFTRESFCDYFVVECEVRELLRVLRMLSAGIAGKYLQHLPPFLEGKIRFDLFRLSEARSFDEVLAAVWHTPYYKLLRGIWAQDPLLRDYPAAEAALVRYYYEAVFVLARKHLDARGQQAVYTLFLQEIEVYNLNVVLRGKVYFGAAYTPKQIRALLVPETYRISKRKLDAMIDARSPEQMIGMYNKLGLGPPVGPADLDAFDAAGGRMLYHHARRMLHLTTTPEAAVAAFISLAKLERDNVVNVIEGVRYGMPPDKIRALIRN